MDKDELLEAIDAKLVQLRPPKLIKPEGIRSVAIMTRGRKQLADLERELLQKLDEIRSDERVPSIITRLATVHLREATIGRAIVLYELTLGLDSNQVNAWINMGLAYLMVSSPKEAISCLGSALAIDQRNTLALVYLAMGLLKQGNFEEANTNLDRAIFIDSNMARALLGKGEYFRAKGELQVAVTWLRRALSMDSTFLPALMELGSVYLALKKYDEAIEVLADALAINPEQAFALSIMGDVYSEQHDLESALYFYDKAVSIKFDDPELWIRKGHSQISEVISASLQCVSKSYQFKSGAC